MSVQLNGKNYNSGEKEKKMMLRLLRTSSESVSQSFISYLIISLFLLLFIKYLGCFSVLEVLVWFELK